MDCIMTVPHKKEGYLSMKKIIAQLLILTLVFSSFAVFPAGAAAAEEVGDAVYYNRTYDEEGKDIKDGLMIVAKSNKIELDGDGRPGHAGRLHRGQPAAGDTLHGI